MAATKAVYIAHGFLLPMATKSRAKARFFLSSVFVFLFSSTCVFAAVLPEDRIDILYHAYDGGGAEIKGPSVLVRKGFADTVSVWGNYYVDMVSSASVDVLATASPYEEERTEYSVGMDYLNDKTIMSLSFTASTENDYDAQTFGFGISQDFFGDLTNVSLGFSIGQDTVRKNEDPPPNDPTFVPFEEDTEHRRYSLGVSQILTKSLIVGMSFETVVDEGFLNNPYRSVRYLDPTVGLGYSWEPEVYPRTHNSDAFAIRGVYYLPYRAALRAEFRSYSDSWGIESEMGELRYTHPLPQWGLTLEGKYRVYSQTGADFFQDLFPFRNFTGEEFRAHDKEMSEFDDTTIGIGITYELKPGWVPYFEKTTVNLFWDHISFDYAEFRDVNDPDAIVAGDETLYTFDADVVRLFVSFWF